MTKILDQLQSLENNLKENEYLLNPEAYPDNLELSAYSHIVKANSLNILFFCINQFIGISKSNEEEFTKETERIKKCYQRCYDQLNPPKKEIHKVNQAVTKRIINSHLSKNKYIGPKKN